MRNIIRKKNSTKAERIFAERLKVLHIPFRHRVIINKREVDFICGRYAIEINGHQQDTDKNVILVRKGFIPIHISNKETKDKNKIISLIKKIKC